MATRFLVLASRFNDTITKALLSGAQDTLSSAGVADANVDLLWVPGAFELATVAAQAAKSKAYGAIICLGAVIRGDTPHFDLVAGQAAAGLQRVGIETGIPVIFGVLSTDTVEQALTRSGIKGGNKGVDAAQAALSMVKTMARLAELTHR
ncbi:MAG: 6,7-dimethyl-8-ribityllumazine synthase [Proteobacteria bacterium]|nr:6,7-dimethyl-8-ribityllumazine synthase [Pseudomonadota bacterium]